MLVRAVTIGCGEFSAIETLAEICRIYKEKYPKVQVSTRPDDQRSYAYQA